MSKFHQNTKRDFNWLLLVLAGQDYSSIAKSSSHTIKTVKESLQSLAELIKPFEHNSSYMTALRFQNDKDRWLEAGAKFWREFSEFEETALSDVQKRNLEWLTRVINGSSCEEIRLEAKLTRGRIYQIVEKAGRIVKNYAHKQNAPCYLPLEKTFAELQNFRSMKQQWLDVVEFYQQNHY